MKNTLKLPLFLLLDILGINALCRTLNRNKAIILFYHGICDEGFALTKRHFPKSAFRRQLEYLKKKGYVFVSLSELVAASKNKKKITRYVTITFDDGFKNIVNNAYPIMKEFGAKGCFYLVSDLIGTQNLLWTDWIETVIRNQPGKNFQFMFNKNIINYVLGDEASYQRVFEDIKSKLRSIPDIERLEHLKQFNSCRITDIPEEFIMASWEQIKQLNLEIIEIGSHTRRHPNCDALDTDAEFENGLKNSKTDIERNLCRKIVHFCYPAGSYNDKVVAKVKQYGYESAVTVEHGFVDKNSDLYRLKRMMGNVEFILFKAVVSGSYNLIRRIKRGIF
jgi:peptidoglycan/xylan/chitin deacetylase (PgdA/CDA1 family)